MALLLVVQSARHENNSYYQNGKPQSYFSSGNKKPVTGTGSGAAGRASVGAGDGEAAQFDQGSAVGVVRQGVEAGDGLVGVLTGEAGGVVQGAAGLHGSADALQVLDAAFLDRAAHQGGLLGTAFAHGVDQRQGRLALGQVVTDVL